ncbi:MAG: Rhodanese-like protein y domain and YceI domain protein [Parcubacteria group bacterium GW2011_GWD2_38_11]|nr:MAG: Rhodanese-like protein y domain and YceI domain protein [Parcubacteria group bacterium GW2011_GWD2_38_11]
MKTVEISAQELKAWLDKKKDFLLIDVLPPEYYNEKHIAGAVSAPVYEVIFLEYVEKLTDNKRKTIVVYNESEDSLSTTDAAIKLKKAGYENVFEFSGGLAKWEAVGYPIEKGNVVEIPIIIDGKYEIDTENSVVGWIGRNAKYAHHGKITIKSGGLIVKDKNIVGGDIVLDMTTIKDDDLKDDALRSVLETHLKSSDFFDVENYPEALFKFDSVEKIKAARAGTPNFIISGLLTIKELANPIEFPAMIVPMEDGVINGQAHFDFDRTLWDVHYGSEKFFEKLGMHLVNDMVSLELFLIAKLR